MKKIIIAPTAKADFADIIIYTTRTWGRSQAQIYIKKINQEIFKIANGSAARIPSAGKISEYQLFRAEKHILACRITENNVTVVRILHHKMHLTQHLN